MKKLQSIGISYDQHSKWPNVHYIVKDDQCRMMLLYVIYMNLK